MKSVCGAVPHSIVYYVNFRSTSPFGHVVILQDLVVLLQCRWQLFYVGGMDNSRCTPANLGPRHFVSQSNPQELSLRIPQAGHAQFWLAPMRWQWLADRLCGTGNLPDGTIRSWAASIVAGQLLTMMPPPLELVSFTPSWPSECLVSLLRIPVCLGDS
jgi:hypothetical protein